MAGLKRFPIYSEVYPDGKLDLNSYNLEALENLVNVVVNKHFSHYNELEDLVSVGLLKCIELLEVNAFDPVKYPAKSALKNFLYTGIRNEVGNYIYHNKNNKKEVVTDIVPINAFDMMDRSLSINNLLDKFIKKHNLDVNTFTYYLKCVGLPIKSSVHSLEGVNEYAYNKYAIMFIHEYVDHIK